MYEKIINRYIERFLNWDIMTKILVTGATGFLGTQLCNFLVSKKKGCDRLR